MADRLMAEEGVFHVKGWAAHCRCGWRGPVRDEPLQAEEDGAAHTCFPLAVFGDAVDAALGLCRERAAKVREGES